LYVLNQDSAALGPGIASGQVIVPSRNAAFRSCNYNLADNARDSELKGAVTSSLIARGLVSRSRLVGPGILWMVADDPTSQSDVLVMVDVETPRTSSSAGTITVLVAAVDSASGRVIGSTATDW
jgi:hypothetical protein